MIGAPLVARRLSTCANRRSMRSRRLLLTLTRLLELAALFDRTARA